MDSKLIDTLNDLIKINRERAAGYQKLTDQLKPTDIDLKTLFTNIVNTSLQHADELGAEVKALGGKVVKERYEDGHLYRLWTGIKASASANDRRSILALCEFGEDATLRAYREATSGEMPVEVKQLLGDHKDEIDRSHHIVKRYRDMQDAFK